eukprot:3227994-Pyramimonas_sp.AAC.1
MDPNGTSPPLELHKVGFGLRAGGGQDASGRGLPEGGSDFLQQHRRELRLRPHVRSAKSRADCYGGRRKEDTCRRQRIQPLETAL